MRWANSMDGEPMASEEFEKGLEEGYAKGRREAITELLDIQEGPLPDYLTDSDEWVLPLSPLEEAANSIPPEMLIALAKRHAEGKATHEGGTEWIRRQGEREFVLDRIHHIVKHCKDLSHQLIYPELSGIHHDTPEQNLGAIVWGAAFLSVAVPKLLKDKE